MQQNKKTLAILFILIVLFSLTAVTYAFFMGGVNNDNPQTAVIETGTMKLTFADNNAGVSGKLNFGESITKLFTLENTGTVEATVDLYWKELTNSYLHGSLMYKLEYATSENGTKSIAVNNSPVPTSETALQTELATQQTIRADTTYYYTLTITLIHSKTIDQTADITASFASGFDIESVRKYPMLAASDTWYTQGGTTVKRSTITAIDIKDSYKPSGTVTSSWDASAAKDGSIMAYIEGTKLTIAGNGSGKIAMNPDSSWAFSDHNTTDYFSKTTIFSNANFLHTDKVTTMYRLFQMCSLTQIDASNWNTNQVENMQTVFSLCSNLSEIIIDNWNTYNTTMMTGMFQGCVKLTSIDLTSFNTSNVSNMRGMFMSNSSYGSMILTEIIGIEDWDVSNVTNMECMFQYCKYITTLNLSKWNTEKVTTMNKMFYQCPKLSIIEGIENWNVNAVIDMTQMFYACNLLTLPSWYDVSTWA